MKFQKDFRTVYYFDRLTKEKQTELNHLFCSHLFWCNVEDILTVMDRILRPEGTVIICDQVHVLDMVKRIVAGMRWNTKMVDNEDGPLLPEKILFAVKQYWVAGENNTTTLQ